MRKQYAASMYSEKSTTSAKSGRSFLSMTAKQPTKVSFWKSLKSWRRSSTGALCTSNKTKDDDMSSVISSSASSSASSLVSYTKFKRFLLPSFSSTNTATTETPSSKHDNNNNNSSSSKEDVNEVVAGQEQYNKELSEKIIITTAAPSSRRARNDDKGILLRDAQAVAERRRQRRQRHSLERVTFIEPSPVPRFRNAPPLPPASPPYLDIIMQQDGGLRRSSIIQHEQEADEPTVFTTPLDDNKDDDDDDDNDEQTAIKTKKKKHHKKRAHLCFKSPLQRGQTLTFSLQNVTPDDHIIVFKFLTSNARLQRARSRRHSSDTLLLHTPSSRWPAAAAASESQSSLMERYFVRPSAGRMIATDQMDIMLFLNHVPGELAPNEILKDKILVRWAVIQRNTQVDAWIQAQPDSTRRKWLEMLVEQWPDQVIVRETRLKIRFM